MVLEQLGVNPESLAVQPQVAPLFRQNGVTPQKLVEILRCDTAPESQKFVQVWDALTPAKRSCAGLEAMAMGAGISPRRLWEVFCGAALIQGKESVGLVIALALPDAMRVTIKEARKPKGHFAREHLFKAARVLPVPKGSTTNINLGSQKELPEGGEDDPGDLEGADDFYLRASRAMGNKALPAPAVEIDSEEDTPEE